MEMKKNTFLNKTYNIKSEKMTKTVTCQLPRSITKKFCSPHKVEHQQNFGALKIIQGYNTYSIVTHQLWN